MELVRPAGQVVAPETRPFWVRQRDSLTHQASQLPGESSPPLHSPLPSRAEGEQGGWGPQVCSLPWKSSGGPSADPRPQGSSSLPPQGEQCPQWCHCHGGTPCKLPTAGNNQGRTQTHCHSTHPEGSAGQLAAPPHVQLSPGPPGSKLTPPPTLPTLATHSAIHKYHLPKTSGPHHNLPRGGLPHPSCQGTQRSPLSSGASLECQSWTQTTQRAPPPMGPDPGPLVTWQV